MDSLKRPRGWGLVKSEKIGKKLKTRWSPNPSRFVFYLPPVPMLWERQAKWTKSSKSHIVISSVHGYPDIILNSVPVKLFKMFECVPWSISIPTVYFHYSWAFILNRLLLFSVLKYHKVYSQMLPTWKSWINVWEFRCLKKNCSGPGDGAEGGEGGRHAGPEALPIRGGPDQGGRPPEEPPAPRPRRPDCQTHPGRTPPGPGGHGRR